MISWLGVLQFNICIWKISVEIITLHHLVFKTHQIYKCLCDLNRYKED
jgi:hypothetical protein